MKSTAHLNTRRAADFCSTGNSGLFRSRSFSVIIIFNSPKSPVIKVTVIKVIKDFRLSKYPSIL